MIDWIIIWKVCLIAALTLFAMMAVLVTFGGAYDIGKMFRRLAESENDNDETNEEK